MSDVSKDDRLNDLIGRFQSLSAGGQLQDATAVLREATALDPENAQVKLAWENLNTGQKNALDLARAYFEHADDENGQKALDALTKSNPNASECRQILELCLNSSDRHGYKRQLAGHLFTLPAITKTLTEVILERPTEIFRLLWASGPDALKGLVNISMSPTSWVSEDDRRKAERDIFMLLLAKLLEPGLDNPDIAMGVIARMLAEDAARFRDIIEPESFDIILTALSIDNDIALRSQATLAIAKILEADKEGGQNLLIQAVISRVAQQGTEDLIIAFSAAAAVFPIVPSMGTALFLTEGFLADLNRLGANSSSQTLRRAALELLSAACIDKSCRQAISEQSSDWLETQAQEQKGRLATLAALVLAKTSASPENRQRKPRQAPKVEGGDDLVAIFKDRLTDPDSAVAENAVEGLAYRSTSPSVKEQLANDPSFLARLVSTLDKAPNAASPLVFGGLTILSNLSQYPPIQSAEQKRMAQLKAYANQSRPAPLDPLEEDSRVTDRCTKVLEAGAATVLVKFSKKASPALFSLISSIVASIAKHPRHRGKMAQQGLFDVALRLATSDSVGNAVPQVKRDAGLALAQMLIRLNPSLLFYNNAVNRPITTTVQALGFLLTPVEVGQGSGTVNYFPVCEALKALTNMAAMSSEVPDDTAINAILITSWTAVEGFLESDISQVRQAATELVCNMCISHATTSLYTSERDGAQRMAVLLRQGMFDGDRGTRLAAGGALAAILGAGGVGNFVQIKGSTGLLRKLVMMAKDEWTEEQQTDELARVLAILLAVIGDPNQGPAVRGQLKSWSGGEGDISSAPAGASGTGASSTVGSSNESSLSSSGGDVVGILRELEASPVGAQASECLRQFRHTATRSGSV